MDYKFDTTIHKIQNDELTRTEMFQIRENAKALLLKGEVRAQEVIDAINLKAVPELEAYYVFMGFCPGADLENRLDDKWTEEGICEFNFIQSETQLKQFCEIHTGDTMILKKRETFGETQNLSYHGKVTGVSDSKVTGLRYLRVDWKKPSKFLIVPLMGCNATVNLRKLEVVERDLPKEFWGWLASGERTVKTKNQKN